MGNMTVNEMDAALSKRGVPSCGVFLACVWVGWMEERRLPKGI
jgi:hypothetical protein